MKIGVIDSGIGGLTTLKTLCEGVGADYYYYMDSANVPFGSKDKRTLQSIAKGILERLERVGVDIVVVACNTLSAVAGGYLRRISSVPVVLIEPSIKPAYMDSKNTIVVATPNTIASEKFRRLLSKFDGVTALASHSLATYIENGYMDKAMSEVDRLLAHRRAENVVLGCTHYVYMREYIEAKGYKVYEGNVGVRGEVKRIIKRLDLKETTLTIHIASSRPFDAQRVTKYLGRPSYLW